MARKKYSCDFETTTAKTSMEETRVWAYGYMEIGNKINMKIGNNLDEFMRWCEKEKADLYFHNLKFDGSFIVNWLLKAGYEWNKSGNPRTFNTIISSMGQWYMIDICYGYKGKKKLHTCIYDSLKKLPFPVKKIAKDFKLKIQKGDIDYDAYRPIDHKITVEEASYIKNDIEIIADALEIQFSQGLTKMTNGSDSLAGFKDVISKKEFDKYFPVLSMDLDKQLRKAYRGGFTWVNDAIQGETIGDGMVFDVNSLYPAQMKFRDLPYGTPIFFEGKYKENDKFPLYIQAISCEFTLKEGYIPTIQVKKSRFKENEYLKSSQGERVELFVTNVDLELIQEHYILHDPVYNGGWMFKKKNGLFNEFIDYWMHIKTTSDGAVKALAKLMLNSLYGKFASNPNVTGKLPYLKENGANGFKLPIVEGEYVPNKVGKMVPKIDEEFKDPVYTPMGIFITSWARYTCITTAQKCYDRILYCDTDSIHISGTEIPDAIKDIVDPDELGFWKYEGTFKRAKFLRQKTYVEDYYAKDVYDEKEGKYVVKLCKPSEATKTKFDVKCAGMPERIKQFVTFENFEIGFRSYGKLLPKQVSGGVILVDTEFTIK